MLSSQHAPTCHRPATRCRPWRSGKCGENVGQAGRHHMVRMAMMVAVALALSLMGGGPAGAKGMKLTSKEIKAGGTIKDEQVFNGFGCSGGNVSPALSWSDAPAKTKSFALTVYDPDA